MPRAAAAPRRSVEGEPVDDAGSARPRFRSTAGDGMGARRADPLAAARIKLRDAFTPSQPVSNPRMFAGRDRLLDQLIHAIENQRVHVVLYGDRGIGKTSLLRVLGRQAGEARYLVDYSSCGEDTGFGDLFRGVAGSVPLLYHADHPPTSDEAARGGTLSDLLGAEPPTPREISDLFARLAGTRLLVILDEFDRSSPTFRRQVAELVKTLSDRSARVQIVIAGVAANLTELVEHIPSIRRNIVGVGVTGLSADEVKQMIRIGERVSGLIYDDAAVDRIAEVADGSPYLAGLLGQHAGFAALDRESTTVGVEDVRVAVRRAADEVGTRLSERSRAAAGRVDEAGRDRLVALAQAALRGTGRFGAPALEAVVPDAGERGRALDELVATGLIEEAGQGEDRHHRFTEEGVPTFLWLTRAARD